MNDVAVLDYLREQFSRLNGKIDGLTQEHRETRERLARLERGVALLQRDVADLNLHLVEQTARMDRIDARLDRIERRLDLADA